MVGPLDFSNSLHELGVIGRETDPWQFLPNTMIGQKTVGKKLNVQTFSSVNSLDHSS